MTSISAVIVCYDEQAEQIRAAIDSLLVQSRPAAEIILVDNGPAGRLAAELDGYAQQLRTIRSKGDFGFGSAVNLAASQARGDYLFCLNPDARAQPDCLDHLAELADADARVALVGGQVLLGDGETRNAGANPLHPTGISMSGGYGLARENAPARDVIVLSGACLLLRRAALLELDGFVEEFFLYYEDTNLAWRAFIAGMRVVYCPGAIVLHDYEFAGRPEKWFLLERNRIFTLLSNYRASTLLLLAPLLLATEAGLLAVATAGGWLPEKLRAYRSLLGLRRALCLRRRAVKASRRRSDSEVIAYMSDRLDSALLPSGWAALANFFAVPYLLAIRHALR